MAIVYKARDMILNRFVAVKVLRDEFTTDEEFIKRFETEAQSAARLTHANIVSIYDVGVDNGIYFIVMELIQGKTLKEIIVEEGGPLPWKWSVNVAIQIASALEVAHRNNIIHRDIKPHNIIITEDGVAKVTDFGIAKAVSNSTITAFGKTIGSVHYFSPEHARGGYTDAKSDLYSLGVVMYEMLTGRVPFDADTPVSVALKHMQETPEEPIELNSNIPEAVNQIIMKALKKEPELRYQNATEMLEDMKMALKNPSGDFVEQREYDPTAATQKIDTQRIKTLEQENQNKKGKKEGKFKKFIRNHKGLSIFIGLILLFTVAFGGTLGILSLTNPKEVLLPNLVGLSKEEAKSEAENAKLVYKEAEEGEYSSEVPEGYVISQDPQYVENYNVKEGSEITVVISKGTEKAIVPNVEGKSQDEAIKMLEDAKLKAEVVEETSQTVKEGYVVSQETEPDTEVSAGDTVKIHVSTGTGIKQVQMVSVIGETEANARSKITGLGLTVNVVYEEDTSKDNGVVLKQSIDSGTTVNEGTSVTITVNKIAETKDATANIKVKEITGGYETETNEDNTTTNTSSNNISKTVTVELTYDGKTETRTVDKNEPNITITLSGKDGNTKTVTVTIKDGNSSIYSSSKDITFGQQTELTFGK